jgi:hypothetical protein
VLSNSYFQVSPDLSGESIGFQKLWTGLQKASLDLSDGGTRLVQSEDRLTETSYRLQEAFTELVRWSRLVPSRTDFKKLSTGFQRGPPDLSGERFLQLLF